MRLTLIRFAVGFFVAGVSGAVDGLIMALASPEAFMEHWHAFTAAAVVLGIKGALMWFKQHEGDLESVINPRTLTDRKD